MMTYILVSLTLNPSKTTRKYRTFRETGKHGPIHICHLNRLYFM